MHNNALPGFDNYELTNRKLSTIHGLFESKAEQFPASDALIFDVENPVSQRQVYSYSELNMKANQLAHYLISLGVKPNMLVGIGMDRSADLIVGILAILKSGGAYLPVDLSYPRERLSFMLEDANASILLTQKKISGTIPQTKSEIIFIEDIDFNAFSTANPEVKMEADDIAYVIYTSGSTGKPNGVMITHHNVLRLFRSTHQWFNFNENDKWTFFHSYAFDFSVWEIWGALLHGGKVVVVPYMVSRSPESFYDLLIREKVTVLNQTPSAFYQLMHAEEFKNNSDTLSLRLVIFGGEALNPGALKPWFARHGDANPKLINMYGITETTVHVTYRPLTSDDLKSGSVIGIPIPDLSIYILDENLNKINNGETGEIYVGGEGLAKGYLNRPELNENRFIKNPFSNGEADRLYKTGDLGRILENNDIEYLGRIDHQVKIRGFRIELGEIENSIRTYKGIKDCVVTVHKYSEEVVHIIAYIVTRGQILTEDIKEHLTKFLPEYMIPNVFLVINKIPLTPNGKTDFKALPIPEQGSRNKIENISRMDPDEIEKIVRQIWIELLGHNNIELDDNFFDVGGNSLLLGRLQLRINKSFNENISIVDLFRYPSINSLAQFINRKSGLAVSNENIVAGNKNSTETDVAIIGIAGRYPGADNIGEFWKNLVDGIESISFFSNEELEYFPKGNLNSELKFVKARGYLKDVDKFDAEFFGFNPREAAIMDPQHRIFLEVAWAALEDAGYCAEKYKGTVGIFAGSSLNTYLIYNVLKDRESVEEMVNSYQIADYATLTGNDNAFLTTKIAYKLGLKGPAINIQTACSTSLVAVEQAYWNLISGQCNMALAGGVSVTFPQKRGYFFVDGSIGSEDGHCKPFDADATGTVFSHGAGIVVMKKLQDALKDGDSIYAVIKSVAVNNDGSDKAGYMTPGIDGQCEVIRRAQKLAGIDPTTIKYVETHGTGTPVGDPIEVASLEKAFRESTSEKQFCGIGSVKSNLGHTDAAAGITGLIKTALSLYHKAIPPTLHYKKPNPAIDFPNSPFYVVDKLIDLKNSQRPLRAAVSAFGVGGTNAHAILEEFPDISYSCEEERDKYLLIVSAKTENSLHNNMIALMDYLKNNPDEAINDLAYTLQVGRKEFQWRQYFVADSCVNAALVIGNIIKDDTNKTKITVTEKPHLVFMFPGQGAQYVNMGKDLYLREKIFQDTVDYCAEYLKPHLELDIRELLFPIYNGEETAKKLEQTVYTQPALFIIEYALAKLFISYGLKPYSMIGHSIGDFTAACLAGVISLDDVLYIIAIRAKLMQKQKPGSMLSVRLNEAAVKEFLSKNISLAAINSPNLVVLSGPTGEIKTLAELLSDRNIENRLLYTSHAYHSGMMEPALDPFRAELRKIRLNYPSIPFVSSMTGTWITDEQAIDPDFWASQIRNTVRFSDGIIELRKKDNLVFLELGPGRALCTMANQHQFNGIKQTTITTLIQPNGVNDDKSNILNAIGKLWTAGLNIDWNVFYKGKKRRRLHLPTYQFDRKSYWVEPSGKTNIKTFATGQTDHKINKVSRKPKAKKVVLENSMTRKEYIIHTLMEVLEDLSGIKKTDLDESKSFFELGFDSLFMTQVSLAFQKKFEVKITLRQLLEFTPTISTIAGFIDSKLPEGKFEPPEKESVVEAEDEEVMEEYEELLPSGQNNEDASTSGENNVERLIKQQLEIMKRQLEILGANKPRSQAYLEKEEMKSILSPIDKKEAVKEKKIFERFGPYNPVKTNRDGSLTNKQQNYLNKLIEEYTAKTASSKKLTQEHRTHYSDPRTVSGFLPLWKEMTYQVITNKSEGSKLWDLDGNEYIDVIMGFGQYMFGHNPEFIRKEIEKQLKAGFEIGPQSPIAGEVAKLVCEFTGFDRAAFCVTGSEAVLGAIRAARTVTGKDKIVFFAGDYHGIIDEVLIKTVVNGNEIRTMPIAPGIPRENVQNTIALEYGTEESLKIIEKLLPEIAGVMVEPVQARRPDFQPQEFLQKLRKITEQAGIPLIFDEVITGFRTAQGGAQEWYGIKADIGTFGKVIGGGFPIGVIAGKKLYMDSFDGGYWQYGDDSIPEAGVTFFAGTFARHPLSLTACLAVLKYLKSKNGSLQKTLNDRTNHLTGELNSFLMQRNVPIKMMNFSSVIYYSYAKDLTFFSLLFYVLRNKGIHILEGFPMFLSESHSEKDIRKIIDAFKGSIIELQENDFFPAPLTGDKNNNHNNIVSEPNKNEYPLTDAQKEIWVASQMSNTASCAFNESARLEFKGKLNFEILERAFDKIIRAHESLRTIFSNDGTYQKIQTVSGFKLKYTNLMMLSEDEKLKILEDKLIKETTILFDFVNGPLLRAELVSFDEETHILIITAHHIICDGWSFDVMIKDLSKIYTEEISGRDSKLIPPMQMREFVFYLESIKSTENYKTQENYWLDKLKPPLNETFLTVDVNRPEVRSFSGSRISGKIESELFAKIKELSNKTNNTIFTTLLSAFSILLSKLSNEIDIITGVPTAGQQVVGAHDLVGHCTNLLPVRFDVNPGKKFEGYLSEVKSLVLDAFENQQVTYGDLITKLKLKRSPGKTPLLSTMFNIDPDIVGLKFTDLECKMFSNPRSGYQFELGFNLVNFDKELIIECDYNSSLFYPDTISKYINYYKNILGKITQNPQISLGEIQLLTYSEMEDILNLLKNSDDV